MSPETDPAAPESPQGLRIHGIDVDPRGRCAHYRGPRDIVSIRFPCCDRWYACHACHDEVEDHDARRWPRNRFDERAVLCGGCAARLTISGYLGSASRCPRCDAPFNPRCVDHHPLYFDVASGRGAIPRSSRTPDRGPPPGRGRTTESGPL